MDDFVGEPKKYPISDLIAATVQQLCPVYAKQPHSIISCGQPSLLLSTADIRIQIPTRKHMISNVFHGKFTALQTDVKQYLQSSVSGKHSNVFVKHSSVYGKHSSVSGKHSNVFVKHSSVYGKHSSVSGKHSNVFVKHSSVYGKHSSVSGKHSNVFVKHSSVYGKHSSVSGKHQVNVSHWISGPAVRGNHSSELLPTASGIGWCTTLF